MSIYSILMENITSKILKVNGTNCPHSLAVDPPRRSNVLHLLERDIFYIN
jgi:hypothetical protein